MILTLTGYQAQCDLCGLCDEWGETWQEAFDAAIQHQWTIHQSIHGSSFQFQVLVCPDHHPYSSITYGGQ